MEQARRDVHIEYTAVQQDAVEVGRAATAAVDIVEAQLVLTVCSGLAVDS